MALQQRGRHVVQHEIHGRAVRVPLAEHRIQRVRPRHLRLRQAFEKAAVDQDLRARQQAAHETRQAFVERPHLARALAAQRFHVRTVQAAFSEGLEDFLLDFHHRRAAVVKRGQRDVLQDVDVVDETPHVVDHLRCRQLKQLFEHHFELRRGPGCHRVTQPAPQLDLAAGTGFRVVKAGGRHGVGVRE